MKLYYASFSFFLILLSCSTVSKSNKLVPTDGFTIIKLENKKEVWTRLQVFNSKQEALNYALDRRLSIQRFHEIKSEPYFGTPAQKNCDDNIDTLGEIIPVKNGMRFFLRVLANEHYAMGDCLKENNSQEAYYEFYICNNGQLVESRHYQPYNLPAPEFLNYQCVP